MTETRNTVLVKLDDHRAERWDRSVLQEFLINAGPGKLIRKGVTQFWVGDTRVRVTETR